MNPGTKPLDPPYNGGNWKVWDLVGARGFEPRTPCAQGRCEIRRPAPDGGIRRVKKGRAVWTCGRERGLAKLEGEVSECNRLISSVEQGT